MNAPEPPILELSIEAAVVVESSRVGVSGALKFSTAPQLLL